MIYCPAARIRTSAVDIGGWRAHAAAMCTIPLQRQPLQPHPRVFGGVAEVQHAWAAAIPAIPNTAYKQVADHCLYGAAARLHL